MKIESATAKQLVAPAAIALVLVLLGAVAVIGAERFLATARGERQAAAALRQGAQNQLARANEEEREIRDKLVDYRKLLERGVIGDEQRLDWVETIGQIKTDRKLFEIKYAISPQKALDLPGLTAGGEVEFRVSELKLDMQLLHEEDLFHVIGDLQRLLKTHVMVRTCSMQRVQQGAPSDRALTPRIKADCVVDLVTIRDRRLKAA